MAEVSSELAELGSPTLGLRAPDFGLRHELRDCRTCTIVARRLLDRFSMVKDPSEKRERANEQEPIDPKDRMTSDEIDETDEEVEIDDEDLVEEIDLDDLDAMEGPDA